MEKKELHEQHCNTTKCEGFKQEHRAEVDGKYYIPPSSLPF
jgi:hypothetical protein